MSMGECTSMLEKAMSSIGFAQMLPPSPVYDLNDMKGATGLSESTIRKRMARLEELGLADYKRGKATIKREVVSQPYVVLQRIIHSLLSLKKARRFGRHYAPTDVNFAKKHLPSDSIITLDHGAYALTGFQTPLVLHAYVDSVEDVSGLLKRHGFREGKKGRVVLLPKIGSFENLIERVFLDCVANGGRSFMDAAAIMLTHGDEVETEVRFTGDVISKVREDLLPNESDH